ncbi:hypothetical protein [Phenylobacterium soli]|uniref:hypothetical protein n=1 Tax=Phenylobacterium soli TaxID=2170551 RepID=UPI001403FB0C|nr:hypothetical protein [Phenylobacterium soli]
MSAFAPYRGAYEADGQRYAWRCYATARIYEVRLADHPLPPPPHGKAWLTAARHPGDDRMHWLVDEGIDRFSQILCAVEAAGPRADAHRHPAHRRRPARPANGDSAYD